jgi:D-arabinose 1-dehydrogenase-like Zn-dependent alcohol dehydrogenase
MNRRQFLDTTAAASTVYSLIPHTVLGANNRVNIGVIGLGGKGSLHFQQFSSMLDVSVIAVSDPDTA